jgi:hypothetical protein
MDIQSIFKEAFSDEVRKDITYEFQMVVKTISEQIINGKNTTPSSYEQREHFFTTQFYKKAEELSLTEIDALDVYDNGQALTEDMIVKEYNGYEIGIEYTREQFSGKPIITSIWKRDI